MFKNLRPEIGIGFGVSGIKQTVIESSDEIARANKVLGPGRLKYIHLGCGFSRLKHGITGGKIGALVRGRGLYDGRY